MADARRIKDPVGTLRTAADRLDEHAACIGGRAGDCGTIQLAADVRSISELLDDQVAYLNWKMHDDISTAQRQLRTEGLGTGHSPSGPHPWGNPA